MRFLRIQLSIAVVEFDYDYGDLQHRLQRSFEWHWRRFDVQLLPIATAPYVAVRRKPLDLSRLGPEEMNCKLINIFGKIKIIFE